MLKLTAKNISQNYIQNEKKKKSKYLISGKTII